MKKIYFLLFAFYLHLYPQISPGDLSNAHSKLEGLKNCIKCHNPGKGLSNQKCLDCHQSIKEKIKLNKGYHSSSEVKNKNCWQCHSEHHGRDFRLINFNEKEFKHEKAGFPLEGKHNKLLCKDCHNTRFIIDKNIKKEKTFLGLSQDCKNCHKDVHLGSAKENCSICHNSENFTNIKQFDHNKTGFDLIGSHKNIKCVKCHLKEQLNNETIIIFSKIKSGNCTNCHRDIHNGKFGNNCLKCHNQESFLSINKVNFDHSKTRFELLGKHKNVNCNQCHKQKLSDKPKFEKCNFCHSDYHNGQLNKYGDCKECHNEYGFSPSLFSLEKHNKTKFPLLGSHINVECNKCHYVNQSWNFVFNNLSCESCHRNIHGDEIKSIDSKDDLCINCHNSYSWDLIGFDHNSTKFKLSGKHLETNCKNCHFKNQTWNFKSITQDCLSCHSDNHNKQFSSNDCNNCHSFDDWTAIYFDHNRTRFKLEGAHKKIKCEKCHERLIDKDGRSYFLYKTGKIKCSDCHS
ncbi:MAG: cytochrome C [Ignavibacterium sp.]|nr:cytochrome C [Ignavibacterium sp.]MDW8375312.1 cytochrome C [Ignavibacteriales bacterium]